MAMDVDGEKKSSGHSAAKTKVVSNGRGTTKKMKAATGRKAKEGKKLESVDCICSKGDDGSPMILCSECKIWYVPFPFSLLPSLFFWAGVYHGRRYHFTCVDITELQAEEISESNSFSFIFAAHIFLPPTDVYICSTCTQTTGRRSASELNLNSFFLPFLLLHIIRQKMFSFSRSYVALYHFVMRYGPNCDDPSAFQACPLRTHTTNRHLLSS